MVGGIMQINQMAMMLHVVLASITFGRAFCCFLVHMNHRTQQHGQEYREQYPCVCIDFMTHDLHLVQR